MAHREMYDIFKELGRCQAIAEHGTDCVTITHGTDNDIDEQDFGTENDNGDEVGIHPSPHLPGQFTEVIDDIVVDIRLGAGIPYVNDGTEIDDDVIVGTRASTDAHDIDSASPLSFNGIHCHEEISLSKYHSRWNNKSIFQDQREEDTFFRVFEIMIDDSIALRTVFGSDVCRLAQSSDFSSIWGRLVEHLGYDSARKKITDKIRTYGRNHRKML